MRYKKGQQVLIKVTILRDLIDTRPKNEVGYEVATERGKVYINSDEIVKVEVEASEPIKNSQKIRM